MAPPLRARPAEEWRAEAEEEKNEERERERESGATTVEKEEAKPLGERDPRRRNYSLERRRRGWRSESRLL